LAGDAPLKKRQDDREGLVKPDLFTGFQPIKPKVNAVVGENPWATASGVGVPNEE